MRRRSPTAVLIAGSVALGLLGPVVLPAFAQTDALYYTDTGTYTLHHVQFGADTPFPMPSGSTDEFPIAVAGDVRTLGGWSDPSRQYDLACSYTGPTFARPAVAAQLFDGTTDGAHNFAMASDGWLYRFDRDWQSPSQVFQPSTRGWGLTYDDANKTFWITDGNGMALQYAKTGGAPISSFPLVPGTFTENAIAWEPITDTLWVIANYGGTVAQQYDKLGNPMATVPLTGGIYPNGGAEFDMGSIPAPGALSLAGLGAMAAARRRR